MGDGVYGQSDLSGNVIEWVADWFANSLVTPCIDCAYLTEVTDNKPQYGGCYSNDATGLFTDDRNSSQPTYRNAQAGARCARAP
jgi:formylglycine-generating enzyme